MARRKISAGEARRIALAAQGFDRQRPDSVSGVAPIRHAIRRIKLLQLDFVNVLTPAHRLVLFSRLGGHDSELFHRAVYQDGHFTEQWAHEASIVPIDLWPALAHRRRDYRPYPGNPLNKLQNKSVYLSEVIESVRKKGPTVTRDLDQPELLKQRAGDWHRSLSRWALEYHFGAGELAVARRLPNFQRVYDLPERVIPETHRHRRMSREQADRELLRRAADACGVGTLHDLADYFRMSPRVAAPRVAELVAAGDVREIEVEGWNSTAYLAAGARCPRRIEAARLLSPFDPLIWCRPRTERLFDFHYRIEIYVPAARRRFGYYVLPFLLDDRLVARVDLKADRAKGHLCVLASHEEDGIDRRRAAAALAGELWRLADWLELEDIRVHRKGKFAPALARAVAKS